MALNPSPTRIVLRSPILAGVNVLFGVLAGLIGAIFHQELADSVPLSFLKNGFSLQSGYGHEVALWFWLLVVAFAAVWAARAAVVARDHQEEMVALEELIETVAPPDFLEAYQFAYMMSVKAETLALKDDAVEPAHELRWILDSLITLAAVWDASSVFDDDVYRANVMIDKDDKKKWDDEIRQAAYSCYGEKEWPRIVPAADGGLWVDPTLATAEEADGRPDDEVSPLLLVYSRDPEIELNIGGAPDAFVGERMCYVKNTNEFVRRFPKGLTASCRDHVSHYYDTDEKARSVISLPLPYEDRIVGVLNIYRNSSDIMGSRSRAEDFALLITPFTVLLGRIVEKLRTTT